jgi:hypothetical protein
MDFNQGELDFNQPTDGSGYRKWQEELDLRKKEIESRYGIILGAKVRLILRGEDKPLEGIITLCDSKEPKNRSKLHLRIGKREFILAEIESVMRL